MKKMMMALAAVVVASMAGATTISWTNASDFEGFKASGDFTLTVNVQLSDYLVTGAWGVGKSNQTVFKLTGPTVAPMDAFSFKLDYVSGSGADGNVVTRGKFYFNEADVAAAQTDAVFNSALTKDSAFTLVFDFSQITDGYNVKMTVTLAGDVVASAARDITTSTHGNYANWDGKTMEWNRLDLGEATASFSGSISGDAVILPEPGVMALLALGVGAIVLRRKQM